MSTKQRAPDPRADKTREALLKATISLGARKGFDNISVRQIAKEAEVNFTAVTYHFGSKEGLRTAVIDHIGEHMRTYGPGKQLRSVTKEQLETLTADQAKAMLKQAMVMTIRSTRHDSDLRDFPLYLHREIFQPGGNARYFYENVFGSEFERMTILVSRVVGADPETEPVRLKTLTLIGQSVFMNLAQPLVQLTMDWDEYEDPMLEAIGDAFWLEP